MQSWAIVGEGEGVGQQGAHVEAALGNPFMDQLVSADASAVDGFILAAVGAVEAEFAEPDGGQINRAAGAGADDDELAAGAGPFEAFIDRLGGADAIEDDIVSA